MEKIKNWMELVDNISNENNPNPKMMAKLLTRINHILKSYQKADYAFNMDVVKPNHQEVFNLHKSVYEQLLIESDISSIFTEIPSLSTNNMITFHLVGVGKWIKLHGGNSSRIFFFDEEKTMISDKTIADFLNKINDVVEKYFYFGQKPLVYYKFKVVPSNDIVDYLKSFGIIPMLYDEPTPVFDYHKQFDKKILLDQSMILTLCSNLSFGLSKSSRVPGDSAQNPVGSLYQSHESDKNKEIMQQNKKELDEYLQGKTMLVNEFVYDQTNYKIASMAGPMENQRFVELSKNLRIIPDISNPRFYYLKQIELLLVSTAEKEHAIIITGNHRLCNKINTYYQEIPYKLFIGAQLVEEKYV